AFLRAQQSENGGWWGRWKVNFLAGSSYALSALAKTGEDTSQGWIRRAIDWVFARQNPDGGFGERIESYADPRLAGCGPSSAQVTGVTLLGLIDAGEGGRTEVARAVSYLLERQLPSGEWPT